jgi:hypothetical protein
MRRPVLADGRSVARVVPASSGTAFGSSAPNLVPGDTNSVGDACVRDRRTGRVERVSVATGGAQADRGSTAVAVSADGRYVVFVSTAIDLVARPEPQADRRLRRTS